MTDQSENILTGNPDGLAGIMKELGIELAALKFGRDQETEVDVKGLHVLHRARIAPEGMMRFFQRLAEQGSRQIKLLSSHPMSEARAERLKEEIARLPPEPSEPFTFDWARVQSALAGSMNAPETLVPE